jgi:hypothetical protein
MTLLESCTTLAVVSTVVLFAAPSLIRAREDYQLHTVAHQIAGKMQWTRIKAISRNRDCRIRVNSAATYVSECQLNGWQADETVALPRGFRLTATASPEFHSRGNAAPTATLTLWDRRSKTRRIVVNITGRVRVE